MAFSSGCDSLHEFPGEHPVDPTLVNVTLTLDIDPEMLPLEPAGISRTDNVYNIRWIIEVFKENFGVGGELVERRVLTQAKAVDGNNKIETPFALNATKYAFAVWADFVDNDRAEDKFYQTQSLAAIHIADNYTGYNDQKDAFMGRQHLDLTAYRNQWNCEISSNLTLNRPLAKIEFITTDLEKYRQKTAGMSAANNSVFKVKLLYTGYLPTGFNVHTDKPNDAHLGIQFDAEVSATPDRDLCLSHDYIFVNGLQSEVTVDMIIYSSIGEVINHVSGISVPIMRSKLTTVRGEFLTHDYDPGIGVDPGFDGDITITIPD